MNSNILMSNALNKAHLECTNAYALLNVISKWHFSLKKLHGQI